MSIQAAVSSLLFHLPVPIGFRIDDNKYEYQENELAAQRLIRAELNIILLHSNMRAEQEALQWGWFWSLPGVSHLQRQTARMASKRFINGVRFHDVAMVFAYWRKPSLIPESVKAQRRERIEDVVMMYCALLITDFFRALVAKRKSAELKKSLQTSIVMKRWMAGDEQCRRRTHFYANILQEEIAFAAAYRKTVSSVRSQSASKHTLIAVPEDGMPANAKVCRHQDAVRQKVRLCRHIHGVDMLRSRGAKQPVLLHFVDMLNQSRPDFFLDMRQVEWKGWQQTESELDTFLRPVRLSSNVHKNPAEWDSYDFTSPGGGVSGLPMEWTLLDVQGFIEEQDGFPTSFVRLNLGSKSAVNELIDSEQREMLLGAVVEVLGYAEVDCMELEGMEGSQSRRRGRGALTDR